VTTVHSIVKRKLTLFLQYFCHNVLHSSCCGGHYPLLPLFSTKELVDFLLFYIIFGCLVNFLHFMDFSRANCVQAMVLLYV